MPRGTRRTSYVRDTRGRFASTPGSGAAKRPPAKKASRGTNRLTRDNSGRITSVGGNGATARGGRLRTGAGNLRARQTDRLKRAPLQGVVSRGGKARAGKAAKKPVGWMQSPEARRDRVQQAADRKGYAKKLRALPKDARRAIQVERMARRQKGIIVAGNTARQLTNIAEGRVRLIGNVGKRKDKLTPVQIGAIARTMKESARRLKVGMATGRRGRMRYNPNALQIATGTAARKIRGARVGGVARRVKPRAAKPQTFNDTLKKANPAAYEKLQKREAKVAKSQQRKAAKLASRNGASAPTGDADARERRSARLSGVSGRIAGRARRIYAQQGERVGAGTLPNRGLFAAPMGRRSTGTNAATSGLQPGRKVRGARPSGTIAKPRNLKAGALAKRSGKPPQPSRPDTAQANIPMRGARGRQLDASISRAVKEVEAAQRARLMKPKEQVRAEAAARKAAKEAAAAAKPKRAPRSAQSLRLSRAKQVEKRRSINISNPAGNRAEAAGRMAANAARTQQRALAFYGGKKPKKVAPPPRPAAPKRVTAGRVAGTIAKPRGMKPGALAAKRTAAPARPARATSKIRPGELMNANARPVGTIAKPKRASDAFKKTKRENLAIAEAIIKRNGFTSYVDTWRSANGVASTSPIRPGKITLAKNSEYWANPAKNSIDQRRQGFWSSSNPAAVIYHEIGHTRAKRTGFINDSSKAWGIGVRPFSSPRNQALARRVGQYATTSPSEFVAEVYAGLRTGRRYDFQVMRAYREEAGFPAASPRRRSRLRRKP
jgi:hypothetical protein